MAEMLTGEAGRWQTAPHSPLQPITWMRLAPGAGSHDPHPAWYAANDPAGTKTLKSAWAPLKGELLSDTVAGITGGVVPTAVIDRRPVPGMPDELLNALPRISVTPAGMVTSVREVPLNAEVPIFVILSGMVMLVKGLLANRPSLISVKLAGKVKL